jgi:hypothetical protein
MTGPIPGGPCIICMAIIFRCFGKAAQRWSNVWMFLPIDLDKANKRFAVTGMALQLVRPWDLGWLVLCTKRCPFIFWLRTVRGPAARTGNKPCKMYPVPVHYFTAHRHRKF